MEGAAMKEHTSDEIAAEAWRLQQEAELKANGRAQEPRNQTASNSEPVTAMALDDFLDRDIPPRETMLSPWLPRCGLAMVHAPRGLGKTLTAIGTAWAVASGGGFLRWKCTRPGRVLFLDGEMPAAVLQDRFQRVVDASGFTLADPTCLKIAASDLGPEGLPDPASGQ